MIEGGWAAARRVLAVRLDNLGDVLLMTPALRALRRALPDASLTLWTSPVGANVGRLDPDIDDVIASEVPWVDPWKRLPGSSERERETIERLRAGRFDAAVIFTSYRQSPLPAAYACYLADIPQRLAATHDGAGSLLTTRHRPPDRLMHEAERALDLVGAIGVSPAEPDLVLAVPEAARATARRVLGARAGTPAIVVHPGCTMPARTYPAARFGEVAALLASEGAQVVVTGTREERPLVERVLAGVPLPLRERCVSLAGELAFDELVAVIDAADAVITNNTGPMHIAAATKTPVVALFALTNPPEQWGPWRVSHRILHRDVPCRLCYARVCPYAQECLDVPAAEVVDAVYALVPGRAPGVLRAASA